MLESVVEDYREELRPISQRFCATSHKIFAKWASCAMLMITELALEF